MVVIAIQMLTAVALMITGLDESNDLIEQVPELAVDGPLVIVSGVITIILLALVVIYYKKRSHMFE